MKRYAPLLAIILLALALATLAGVNKFRTPPTPVAKAVKPATAPEAKPAAITRQAGAGFDVPYAPANVKAVLKPYTVKADLSNVANAKLFGKFTPEQKTLLTKNAFFVAPTEEQQLFYIYEQNDYLNIPSFITSDSVLQVYHIFFDFTLRKVETDKLYGILESLTDAMQAESARVSPQMTTADWKLAASRNQVYFAVPSTVLGRKITLTDPEQKRMFDFEWQEITEAQGRPGDPSPLFTPLHPDYSQFIVRGHYTRSDLLKRFFKAMMWYGYMPINVGEKRSPNLDRVRQSLLITRMLYTAKVDGKPAIEAWDRIYEPTVFYVGACDDLTPSEIKPIIDKVYGHNATYEDLQDESKLAQAAAAIMDLPPPQIVPAMVGGPAPGGRVFKFMGQRYIPDSEVLQGLSHWPERTFPKGLDVMAVFGSKRAADILDNTYKEPKKWPDYLPARAELTKKFGATPQETWQSNLYWGWLWGLDSLLDTFGEGYPSFMTNQAWQDKDLNTGLASWAELRHDTILYAKQSGVECGDGEEELPLPQGYVEPNVEFYGRLLWLTQASRAGLDQRRLLSDDLRDSFKSFEDMITFLRSVSVKELTNQKLTKAEYDQIRLYGANLEYLTMSVIEGGGTSWYEITSEADKNMAVIADVHTSEGACLEEAVGHAQEIYVIVPIEGKLYLTRGAVFSYYEFTQAANDRLTDEKWQKMLKDKKAPDVPIWMKSFRAGKKTAVPVPKKTRSTGC